MAAAGLPDLLDAGDPVVALADGAGRVRVIAGEFDGQRGPARTFTPIDVWDVRLNAGHAATLRAAGGPHARAGGAARHGAGQRQPRSRARRSWCSSTATAPTIAIEANSDATVLLLSGEPIDEPIVGYGPFVMNTPGRDRAGDHRLQQRAFGQMH